jgi:hypothetical protein
MTLILLESPEKKLRQSQMAIVKLLEYSFDFGVHLPPWHRQDASNNLQSALFRVRIERAEEYASGVGLDDDPSSVCLHRNIALLESGTTQLLVKGPFTASLDGILSHS